MLNDLARYRAALEEEADAPVPESVAAYRWRAEVFEPAIAAVPGELWTKRPAAEVFHEILDHRWYLSEQSGSDVGLDTAVRSYVEDVLRHKPDERLVLRSGLADPGGGLGGRRRMSERPRLLGVNHVALEVGDLEEALEWYGRIFDVRRLRGRAPGMAFLDMGDQFLALAEGRRQPADDGRHFGLVVDDKEAARRRLEEAGARIAPGRRLDFFDPWGNRVEVVDYRDVQFTKAP